MSWIRDNKGPGVACYWRWSHRCSDPAPVINEVSLPGPGRLLLGTIILHRLREKDVNFTFMIDLDRAQWLDGVMIWWCCLRCELRLWLWLLGPEIYHSSLLDKSDCQPVSLSICISRYLVLDIQISNKWNLNKSPCPLPTRVCGLKCTTMALIRTQSILDILVQFCTIWSFPCFALP